MHLDLAMRLGLETFDDHEIDRRHLLEQFRQPRLGRAAQLMHQGPSPAGGHQNFGGAGLPVHPGILARYVDIKTVVGVLDHGNTQALAKQMRDDTRQQRRLAGAAPAREAYHFHLILRAARGNRGYVLSCGALYRLTGNVMLASRKMMKIDKAPVPLILPNPQDPRLTERVAGTDQTGAAVEINVPVERPLTLYLNAQEIVTMMTIGDY